MEEYYKRKRESAKKDFTSKEQDDDETKEIESIIQKDIKGIVSNIRKHSNARVLNYYYSEIDMLLKYAEKVGIKIEDPLLYRVCGLEKTDKIINEYYNREFDHYVDTYSTNKTLAYRVNTMFDQNGSLPELMDFKRLVNPVSLALDFLNYYDKDIYKYLKSELKAGHVYDWAIDENNAGVTLNFQSLEKSYIFVHSGLEENVHKASTLIHEVVHSYFNYITKGKSYDEENLMRINRLYETYPLFIELVFIDWLRKVRFKEYDIRTLDSIFNKSFQLFSQNFSQLLYIFESFLDDDFVQDYYKNEGSEENLEYAFAACDLLEKFNVDITPDEIVDDPNAVSLDIEYPAGFDLYDSLDLLGGPDPYFYGSLLAYHFLDQYRENPEKAKDNITRFTLDSSKKNKLDLLDGYGLGLNNIKDVSKIKKHIYKKDCYK